MNLQQELFDEYMLRYHPFQKGDIFNPVQLHTRFVQFLQAGNHIDCFPGQVTKKPLTEYLTNTLQLKRNYRTKQYWIKNHQEANRLNKMFC